MTWSRERGWQPYQRIGTALLMISAKQARGLVAIYEKQARKPEWKTTAEGLAGMFIELTKIADECDRKNAAKELPPEAALAMPAEGRA